MGIWSFGRGLIDDVYVLLILKVVEIEIPPFSIILYGERGTHLLKKHIIHNICSATCSNWVRQCMGKMGL